MNEEGGACTLSVERKVEVLNITVCAEDFAQVCLVDVARELLYHDLEDGSVQLEFLKNGGIVTFELLGVGDLLGLRV